MKKQRRTHAVPGPSDAGVRDSRRSMWASVAIVVIAIVLTYWNSIQAPFQFDDVSPVENEAVRQSASVDDSQSSELAVQVAGRPVVWASFALNNALGGRDVTGYHVLNISVHVACALLLFAINTRCQSNCVAGTEFRLRRCGRVARSFRAAAELKESLHHLLDCGPHRDRTPGLKTRR